MLLSFNDLLVGVFGNNSFTIVVFATINGYKSCEFFIAFEFATFLTVSMSVMTLLVLNIERYLCVLHPFYHRIKVTKSRLLKVVVALWVLPILKRSSYLIFGKIMKKIMSFTIGITVLSTLYIYASICVEIRRRPRLTETGEREGRSTDARNIAGRMHQTQDLQNMKMTKSCAIVVGLSVACNLPIAFTHALPSTNLSTLLSLWSMTVLFSASSFNSLVFFWSSPMLRKEAKKLFQNVN
jgi:hypothetical protein